MTTTVVPFTSRRNAAAVARAYFERGWAPLPVEPRGKNPTTGEGWQDVRLTQEGIGLAFAPDDNVGVILGTPSAGLVDVDLDAPEAWRLADEFFPRTPLAFGRRSKPRSHRLYNCGGECGRVRKWVLPTGERNGTETIVEVRATGGQTVFPGSTHESGEAVEWAGPDDAAPAAVERADLDRAAARLAAACVLVRLWPPRPAPGTSGARNAAAMALAGALLRIGWPVEDAEAFLRTVARAAGDEEAESRAAQAADTARSRTDGEHVTGWPKLAELLGNERAVRTVRRWLGGFETAEDGRPIVLVRDEFAALLDEAEHALAEAEDVGLYVRAGGLVRVVRDSVPHVGGIRRPDGGPCIVSVDVPTMRERLDRIARWVRQGKDRKTGAAVTLSTLPPVWLAEAILSPREWRFPYLAAIAEAPTLRPDGSVLDRPGYDAATGLLYEPAATYPPIPSAPTRDDAARAALELLEPFQDFPFVSDCDRAATLAGMLSLPARSAIYGPVPMHAFRAPAPGTGKSILAEGINLAMTGRGPALMSAPRDDDEARKRILAIALDGVRSVCLDNVEGALGSPALAAALTSVTFSDRLLGVNRTVTAPLRACWFATGNNLTFKGDLGRRVIPIDLDAQVEHPEDRTGFRHPDLLGYCRAEHPRLVVAALTLLRAYFVAGMQPHGKPAKGSFEAWDRLVRGAVVWATGDDPLEGTERIREEGDAELDALRAGLAAWRDLLGPDGGTAAEALGRAEHNEANRTALAIFSGCDVKKLDARRIGYALRRYRGRLADGLRFVEIGKARGAGRSWKAASSEDRS